MFFLEHFMKDRYNVDMTNETTSSGYWVDIICDAIEAKHPSGSLRVCSGISPSGPYHIGHTREVLTADAVLRGLTKRGRKVDHIHFVDDFDALRKRYPYLPESYEEEVGKPLYLVPAPDGKSKSYADQFFSEYERAIEQLGVEMTVVRIHKEYQKGTFAPYIAKSLEQRDQIAAILEQVSGRAVEDDWQPIQILDETNNSLRSTKFVGFDSQTGLVTYLGSDNKKHHADINKCQVKLDWRVHWPAWWGIWANQVEGFGREHATKGGSYDTGVEIAKQIFAIEPPYPVPYETINLKGETKKMSSSLGNLVSIKNALSVIPPEVLRYFTFKSRPERQLFFDTGLGLYNLMDEYAKTESETLAGNSPEFKEAWQISSLSGKDHVISTVPFSHLVSTYQTARGDEVEILTILKRSGHEQAVRLQEDAIIKELGYVKKWLEDYAPENVKFEVLSTTPSLSLNKTQQLFLTGLIEKFESIEFSAEVIHSTIYDIAVSSELGGKDAFTLIYQLFIGKDSGPRAGYFLASLGKEFVLTRLQETLNI